jgi:DNA ligase D-like protein (predicted polymerase)
VADSIAIETGGIEVSITHPDKAFFSKRGETKLDLVQYYQAVEQPLMATIGGRPVLLERYPEGAGGKSFFQKRVPKSAPSWLTTTVVETPNGTTSDALVAADLAHLLWAVNQGCLGFHVWPTRATTPEVADELRIDLDPSPGVGFEQLQQAAALVHAFFEELAIEAWVKTSGSRGLHVYVGLQPRWDSYEVRAAAVALARELERRHPDLVEGGARQPRLRRLQPERAPQDRLRRVVRTTPRRRAGVHPDRLGRARVGRPRRAHDRDGAGPRGRTRRPVGGQAEPPAGPRAAAGPVAPRPGQRPDGRAVATRLPEAAERATPRGAEPGRSSQRDLTGGSRSRLPRCRPPVTRPIQGER